MKLTEAQLWALKGIAGGSGDSPAALGSHMMDRPGVEEKRRGGNRDSRQGLGRIGGTMMHRLERMGLVTLIGMSYGHWHPNRAKLTVAGRKALKSHGG